MLGLNGFPFTWNLEYVPPESSSHLVVAVADCHKPKWQFLKLATGHRETPSSHYHVSEDGDVGLSSRDNLHDIITVMTNNYSDSA